MPRDMSPQGPILCCISDTKPSVVWWCMCVWQLAMVSAVLARRCGLPFLGATLSTFVVYTLFTMYVTLVL